MKNKCPKCGFEYDEFDIYCSRCGQKLSGSTENTAVEAEQKAPFETLEDNFSLNDNIETKTFRPSAKSILDSSAFNFILFLLVMLVLLLFVMNFVLNKHAQNKMQLQYKNLISNPAQIPLLKDEQTFSEFASNLANVEKFLLMYLKYSKDSIDKKEQIFSSYLKEINKVPKITSENTEDVLIKQCTNINSSKKAKNCACALNKKFKGTGVSAYQNADKIYLYPNNKFINKTYSKYLSNSFKQYLLLAAKYNKPSSLGLELYIKPKELADKIYDFENIFIKTDNHFIKEETQLTLYRDFRKFIFTPSIYATTTQEMKPEFKKAYNYFIRKKKDSSLRPVVMSYMDKKRSYSEENFKNDYPYKIFKNNFDDNVENSAFCDVFVQLRKNIFSQSSELVLTYVYNIPTGKWSRYTPSTPLKDGEYVISEVDENNNIEIYNSAFSPLQELNIYKYGKIYLINDSLYVFNKDKLSISKLIFNGKMFNLRTLAHSDITSLFPGIEVINIDSFSNYNVYIEKDNAKANYILLSKYQSGWDDYSLGIVKGNATPYVLPNMFGVNSVDDVVISFGAQNDTEDGEISQTTPAYKIIIHTKGQPSIQNSVKENPYVQYDEKTARDEEDDETLQHFPNIMPKIPSQSHEQGSIQEELNPAPKQTIEPPSDEKE